MPASKSTPVQERMIVVLHTFNCIRRTLLIAFKFLVSAKLHVALMLLSGVV